MKWSGLAAPLVFGLACSPASADRGALATVLPVMACEALVSASLGNGELATVKLQASATIETAQGPFCKVSGTIGPGTIAFQVYLPAKRWTQRYVQTAQNRLTVPLAGTNPQALRGELAIAITDKGGPGISRDTLWTSDNQQKRIDWAYRANHMTALAAKALIQTFYGRRQRYAYFVGCSMGGREALSEIQHFPADFNGVVAGAPVVLDSVHNAFYPGWEWAANRRSDGSIVLRQGDLAILHDAAIRNCARRSGLIDGMLQHPGACTFDPAWVICPKSRPAGALCLTAEQASAARKLYTGPTDPKGRLLDAGGFPLGSELSWRLSTTGGAANPATDPGNALVRLLAPTNPAENAESMRRRFAFDAAWFDRAAAMAPLWNTANTDLGPFRAAGGKLILWIGAADPTVQPASTIAYYEGLQETLGREATDSFARFFLLPGVNHCGGGEGPDQFDQLSALMDWTEQGKAPAKLVAGKVQRQKLDDTQPYSVAALPASFTRPIFPYPLVARYAGKGDRRDAASYVEAMPPTLQRQRLPPEIAQFFGPGNQSFYRVENGKLEPVGQ